MIKTKRVYETQEMTDGIRILVDRLWPRGISKEDAKIDLWLKEIAPSNELRKWYNHTPEKWDEFKQKYFQELENLPNKEQVLEPIIHHLRKGNVTLLYASKEMKYNNAIALKEYLDKKYSRLH